MSLMSPRSPAFKRTVAVLLCVAILGAGCGGGATEVAADPTTTITVLPTVAESTTSTSSTSATATTTTSTVRPPDPFETFVATIKPDVELLEPHLEPDGDSEYVQLEFAVTNPTYFDNPLVLMVTDRTDDGGWLKVQIPVRPNGTEGWIPAEQAVLSSHFVRATVNLTDRIVKVWDGDELIAETGAVIGTANTPTPVGKFFVNDLVQKWDGSAYGPYILSLSGFSEALETFGGGVPVIAIHGTNRPELVGGAHSNGCIRVPNEVVTFLAEHVPMGTPVDIAA
jgi:lipoprotein-anchoring transpeptidase ErfK/SrfK